MIINVNDYELENSLDEVKEFINKNNNFLNYINSIIYDTSKRLNNMSSDINQKLSKWNNILNLLKQRNDKLTLEKKQLESNIKRLNEEYIITSNKINNLREPYYSEEIKYVDGIEVKEKVYIDPDGDLRTQLQSKIITLKNKINESKKKLDNINEELQILKEDIDNIKKYLDKLKEANKNIIDAKNIISNCKSIITKSVNNTNNNLVDISNKIDILKEYINEFNSLTYNFYNYEQNYNIKKINYCIDYDSSHSNNISFALNNITNNNLSKELNKLSLLDSKTVEIIGKYENESELSNDLDNLNSNIKIIKVKKLFKSFIPFYENIKTLTSYFENKGFIPKYNSLGSRYFDIDNNMYFLKK